MKYTFHITITQFLHSSKFNVSDAKRIGNEEALDEPLSQLRQVLDWWRMSSDVAIGPRQA